jgi:hypothetical protein
VTRLNFLNAFQYHAVYSERQKYGINSLKIKQNFFKLISNTIFDLFLFDCNYTRGLFCPNKIEFFTIIWWFVESIYQKETKLEFKKWNFILDEKNLERNSMR